EQEKNLSEISRRKMALGAMVKGVEDLRHGIACWWPWAPFAFFAIIKRLTKQPITVTGKQLAAFPAGLRDTGYKTYLPDALVDGLEELCRSTHSELESIITAIRTTQSNSTEIKSSLANVLTKKPEMDKRALPFDKYQTRLDGLNTRAAALDGLMYSN